MYEDDEDRCVNGEVNRANCIHKQIISNVSGLQKHEAKLTDSSPPTCMQKGH